MDWIDPADIEHPADIVWGGRDPFPISVDFLQYSVGYDPALSRFG